MLFDVDLFVGSKSLVVMLLGRYLQIRHGRRYSIWIYRLDVLDYWRHIT
jgi:hypothetical protein